MKFIIIHELKKYTLLNILLWFENDKEVCQNFVKLCEKRKILERRKEIYSFRYVGILVYENRLMLFVPKYFSVSTSKDEALREMHLIIQVFKKISLQSIEKDSIDTYGDSIFDESFQLLNVIDFLMQDYLDYGIYRKEKKEYILHGQGEIDWQKTIDTQQGYLINSYTPIYFDMVTEENLEDKEHILIALHKYVLTCCEQFLWETGLNLFFTYPNLNFSNEDCIVPDEEVQLELIQSAIQEEFNDRKISLLKGMYSFISRKEVSPSNQSIIFYGTRSFHVIWEKCCAFIMGHQPQIISQISRPKWIAQNIEDVSKDTLIPDITRIINNKERSILLIADAKYYNIVFRNNKVYGQPGIEDIVKQQIYEKALYPFMKRKGCTHIYNVFLFPIQETNIRKFGEVSLSFLMELQPIQLFYFPAKKVFEDFINQRSWNSDEWDHFIQKIKENIDYTEI